MAQEAKKTPEWLTVTNDSARITLSSPIAINDVKTDQLVLRSPTIREVRAATRAGGDDEEQRELILFASLSDAGQKDLEGLSVRDYKRVQTAYFRLVREDGV
ncbi:phage tail assembly protein [Pseudomonas sp. HY13-MNA-CIBAN-0226]|uniref:phage tail assembly protein n=1 Tax=Pseudomonas sp. HY13-MNA-CIBAN-0226 TaxID=3140473 RepID=UPI0033264AB3